VARPATGWSALAQLEKIMSKTSYSAAATSDRELTEAELDVVAGGNWAWAVVIVGAI
jgi:hypothetical protein